MQLMITMKLNSVVNDSKHSIESHSPMKLIVNGIPIEPKNNNHNNNLPLWCDRLNSLQDLVRDSDIKYPAKLNQIELIILCVIDTIRIVITDRIVDTVNATNTILRWNIVEYATNFLMS
jgi:hypothetical protein